MDSLIPTLRILRGSAWVYSLTSIVTQPSRVQDDILEKVCICIMSVERFMLNVSVTRPSLCRVGIVTTVTAFTQQQCARFHQAARWKFSTTKNSHSCFHSQSITILQLCMSWLRCVQFAWVLSKAGEQSTIARMLPALHVGLKSIFVVPSSGWIKCFARWVCQKMGQLLTQCSVTCTWRYCAQG